MAERDELARPLGAHDAGQLRDPEDVALRAAAIDDEAHRLGRQGDGRLRHGTPRGDGLGRDVDHPRPPGPVDVGEAPALEPRGGLLVHAVEDSGRGQARSSHHSSTSAPAGSSSCASGDDREGVGGGQGRDHVAPLPARQADRHAPLRVADGRARGVALGDDPLVAAATRALADGTGPGRPGRPRVQVVVAAAGEPPQRRAHEELEGHEGRHRVAGQPEEQDRRRRPPPSRTRTACPAGP